MRLQLKVNFLLFQGHARDADATCKKDWESSKQSIMIQVNFVVINSLLHSISQGYLQP